MSLQSDSTCFPLVRSLPAYASKSFARISRSGSCPPARLPSVSTRIRLVNARLLSLLPPIVSGFKRESRLIALVSPTVAKTSRFAAHYGNESQLTERALRAITAVVSAIIRSHQRCDRETLRKTRSEPAMLARDALLSNFLCNTGVRFDPAETFIPSLSPRDLRTNPS